MTLDVFLLVLAAAFVHATWNALIKSDTDRPTIIKIMCGTQVVLSLAFAPFHALPEMASWPCLVASPILGTCYMVLLNRAYETGDLSLVYPLARGVAPLLVAAISVAVLDERLSPANVAAVAIIGLGITSLALTRGAGGGGEARSVLLSLAIGACIAGYTVVDGLGARLAGSSSSYMIWLTILTSSLVIVMMRRQTRGQARPIDRRALTKGGLVGVISYAATWVIIWAMTQAPLALVSALRETGVVFAVVIGVVVLKERVNFARLVSVAATIAGTALLKLGR